MTKLVNITFFFYVSCAAAGCVVRPVRRTAPTARREGPAVSTVADPEDLGIWVRQPDEPRRYTVQRGDTWWGLARRWGVTPDRLADFNGLSVSAVLQAGQVLAVPFLEAPLRNASAPGRSL